MENALWTHNLAALSIVVAGVFLSSGGPPAPQRLSAPEDLIGGEWSLNACSYPGVTAIEACKVCLNYSGDPFDNPNNYSGEECQTSTKDETCLGVTVDDDPDPSCEFKDTQCPGHMVFFAGIEGLAGYPCNGNVVEEEDVPCTKTYRETRDGAPTFNTRCFETGGPGGGI